MTSILQPHQRYTYLRGVADVRPCQPARSVRRRPGDVSTDIVENVFTIRRKLVTVTVQYVTHFVRRTETPIRRHCCVGAVLYRLRRAAEAFAKADVVKHRHIQCAQADSYRDRQRNYVNLCFHVCTHSTDMYLTTSIGVNAKTQNSTCSICCGNATA